MAEGAGALVLESYDSAKARGAKIIGVLAGGGEMADSFHRTRSSPDGKPIIGCIQRRLRTPASRRRTSTTSTRTVPAPRRTTRWKRSE